MTKKNLKNLFVTGYLYKGGGADALSEFIRLSQIKNPYIISANVDGVIYKEKFKPIPIFDAGKKLNRCPLFVKWISLLIAVVRQRSVNVIYTNDMQSLLIVASIPFLSCKKIHFMHDDINGYKSKLIRGIISWGLNRCDTVVSNSKYTEKSLSQILSKKIHLTLLYQPLEAEVVPLPKDVRFVISSRIAQDKNIMSILEAFNALRFDHGLSPTLDIYGKANTPRDKEYMTSLEKFVEKSKLKNVRFLGWTEDKNTIYSNYSHYISASVRESFGRSTVEALVRGLVPVVSNIPAHQEFINETNGFLFEINDKIRLTKLLLYLSTTYNPNNLRSDHSLVQEIFSKRNFVIAAKRINGE